MHRTMRSAPILSPGTARSIIEQFKVPQDYPSDSLSSSSDSPDSLYSNNSPTFPDTAFEFDENLIDSTEIAIESRDPDEYDQTYEDDGSEGYGSPSWGRWPESRSAEPGWSPSVRSKASEKGSQCGTPTRSMISLSPRGSLSHSLTDSRRNSTTPSRLRADAQQIRRDSNPSLLGFDLTKQARRSSDRSLRIRRRSSAVSSGNGSVVDSMEDIRLRNVASMDMLGRRFSDVVEVTCPSDSDSERIGAEDTAVARARMSAWSPDSASDGGSEGAGVARARSIVWSPASSSDHDTDSEIHTAPYFPTPPMNSRVPGLLSNFPLSSAVREDVPATPSDYSLSPSPAVPQRVLRSISQRPISTPPPPTQPSVLIRDRVRPAIPRTTTDYTTPPRSEGVPPGAAPPRPSMMTRSASNPMFSAAPAAKEAAFILERRVAGSFPVARATPLGVSPLRTSQHRESIVSEGGSTDPRRPSAASYLSSTVDPISRRQSAEARRSSKSGPSTRQGSLASLGRKSREGSLAITMARDGSRGSKGSLNGDRRPSKTSISMSRKSSVVSIGEYGYLAPQIVVETPPVPAIIVDRKALLRSNAPDFITLPTFAFPATAPNTPYTPRVYNPLESFLGIDSISPITPVPSTPSSTFGPLSPFAPPAELDKTPVPGSISIMDRGRPISPEQQHAFPRSRNTISPKTSPRSSDNSHHYQPLPVLVPASSTPSPTLSETIAVPQGISRKPVPKLSREQLRREEKLDARLRDQRQVVAESYRMHDAPGNLNHTAADQAILRASQPHRRTISVDIDQHSQQRQRPSVRRQATLPPTLDIVSQKRRSQVIERLQSERMDERERAGAPLYVGKGKEREDLGHGKTLSKRSSVTFNETPQSIQTQRSDFGRSSSFTRFFHSKPKQPSSPASGGKPLKSSIRPVSMDIGDRSPRSDRERGDVREIFRRLGSGGSPKDLA